MRTLAAFTGIALILMGIFLVATFPDLVRADALPSSDIFRGLYFCSSVGLLLGGTALFGLALNGKV